VFLVMRQLEVRNLLYLNAKRMPTKWIPGPEIGSSYLFVIVENLDFDEGIEEQWYSRGAG